MSPLAWLPSNRTRNLISINGDTSIDVYSKRLSDYRDYISPCWPGWDGNTSTVLNHFVVNGSSFLQARLISLSIMLLSTCAN